MNVLFFPFRWMEVAFQTVFVEWVTSVKWGVGVLSIDYIDALFGRLFNQTLSTSEMF